MIPTNRHLPLQITESPMNPLHDECSGLANLERRQHAKHRWNPVDFVFGFGTAAILAGLLWLAIYK
jgi:hypothetical protein